MGAGTSAEQVADKPKEEQAEQSNDLGQQEQNGQEVEVDGAADVKLLHKNGKIAILNGTSEGEEIVEVIIEDEDINGYQEEEVKKDVEQTEPPRVTLNGEQEENIEVTPSDAASKENTKEDGQDEAPEINDTSPVCEEKVESPEQSNESQSNEVGFKKVFKFVGFKFTVKKDKTEKSEPVQLLTVKKEEAEVNGTTSQEEHIDAADEDKTITKQETKDDVQPPESPDGAPQVVESPVEVPEEAQKNDESPETQKQEESEVDKDKKSPESPTNTVVTDTSSPFKRFFTQGWAGLRKKTSFKKSKEEDPQEVEKHIKGEEQEKTDGPEAVKEENESTKETVEEQPIPEETIEPASEEAKSSNVEDSQLSPEEIKAEIAPSDQADDQKPEENVKETETIVVVSEEKENVPETSVLTVSSEVKTETDTLEIKPENTTDVVSPTSVEVAHEAQVEEAPQTEIPVIEQAVLQSSTESGDLEKGQEVLTTEVELLSSQEKVKAQGSPLKKLFSSSGLRKLSGKKSKGKKDDDAKADVTTDQALTSSESPEAAEVDGSDSSPSSPDESAETSPTEKPAAEEESQAADVEGEGATSDGERKKDGITPWASFKKLVTPKRRPKRPSESDKEDEGEKVKTSTMSSTDSGGSVENQEETKETNEEPKLEKSTEENKKKADSSVSWDALICVGSSKKRARKTSDSDEEEIQKSQEEGKKNEVEPVQANEPESESPITSSQEQQVQESPSPDQASSPTEGDGVSTWQSFKRLVTPRRKSKTKVEEKAEETAVASNPEQSTSEGEGGKEESWVSFKKLIPGRRKKRSDAKQEQAPLSADQQIQESTEEDSDEPAVVPLAEFDAAELEKLNAQKSVSTDLSGELKESLENPSDELVHAVTVTLIEGERAVTSLEERAPSWISAKVNETIEHAKEVEETTEKIKNEITVEETVVLSTVSQVMAETQSTLINEVDLTSEALTALEEAIETSCAEETTEMLSAVSQLGESLMSTEQATPVAEDDASLQTLQEQKQLTENILHAVAESTKFSSDILKPENVLQDANEEQSATTELQEEQKLVSNVVEEHIKEDSALLNETMQVESEVKVSEPSVDENEKPSESVDVPAYNHDTDGSSISAEEKIEKTISYDATEKSGEDSAKVQVKETLESGEINIEVKEQTTELKTTYTELSSQEIIDPLKEQHTKEVESKVCGPDAINSVVDIDISLTQVQAETSIPVLTEIEAKESIIVAPELPASDVKDVEEPAPVSAELQDKDIYVKSLRSDVKDEVSVTAEVKAAESIPVADQVETVKSEIQSEESNLVRSEAQAKEEVDQVPPEVQVDKNTFVADDLKNEESDAVPCVAKAEESALVSHEVKVEESSFVPHELQEKEGAPVLADVEAKESVAKLCKAQAEESVSAIAEVEAKESDVVLCEVQAEEGISVLDEEKAEETIAAPCEVQVEEASPVQSEVEIKEDDSVPSEVQVDESTTLLSEVQDNETAPLPSETECASAIAEAEAKESDVVLCEVQAEEGVSVLAEEKAEETIAALYEVQVEEASPVQSEVEIKEDDSVPSEVQVEESTTLLSEVQDEETAPLPSETESASIPSKVQEGVSVEPMLEVDAGAVPSDVQEEEASSVPSETQVTKAGLASSELHAEEPESVLSEEQTEDVVSVPSEVLAEDVSVLDVKAEEAAPVVAKVETEESVAVLPDMQVEEICDHTAGDDTVTVYVQTEDVLTQEIQGEESALVLSEPNAEGLSMPFEVQANEATSVLTTLQANDGNSMKTGEQVAEDAKVAEVLTEEGSPILTEAQAENDETVATKVFAEECVLVSTEADVPIASEVKAEEDVPVSAEMVAEDVPVSAECKAQESVLVSKEEPELIDEKLEVAVTALPEKQDEKHIAVSTELNVEKGITECVDGHVQKTISLPDKIDIEVNTSELVKELSEDAGIEEEQAEKEQLAEENVPVEEKDDKDVPVLADEQGKEDVLAEVQTEVLPQKQAEEGVITSAEENGEPAAESILQSVVKDQLKSTGPTCESLVEELKEPEECKIEEHEDRGDSGSLNNIVNQLSLQDVAEVVEETIATDIPEFETSEANKASEPVTAASVEENMLTETVQPFETTSDCIQLTEEPNQSEEQTEKPEKLQTLVASVSQKAAAIVDAAIEAATNSFVVDASSQCDTTEDTTLNDEKHQTEESVVETNSTKFKSTTTVHITIETTVEKVSEVGNDKECVSPKRENLEEEIVSKAQEHVPAHELTGVLSTSVQTKENETSDEDKPSTQDCSLIASTDLVDQESTEITLHVVEESKPINIQEDIHITSVQTDSSTTDTQEKAQPVES